MNLNTTISKINTAISKQVADYSDTQTKAMVSTMVAVQTLSKEFGMEHAPFPLETAYEVRDAITAEVKEAITAALKQNGYKHDTAAVEKTLLSPVTQEAINTRMAAELTKLVMAAKHKSERNKEEMSGITRSNQPERVVRHASLEPETGRVKS